jgi:cysteine/glycine-rich protein
MYTYLHSADSMSGKFGGGGSLCAICTKTVYPAETVQYEKKPYHVDCFKCNVCDKKMENSSKADLYEDKLFCKSCFAKGGYAQKQKNVVWTASEGGSAPASKFGGGGTSCHICSKTVYPAETVTYDKICYHQDCFKCTTCDKKMTPSGAAQFEGAVFCTKCFKDGGYHQKQAATAKTGGGSGTGSAVASRFGGGGNKCVRCEKTVYPAETVSFEKNFFHPACFTCLGCSKQVSASGAEGQKKPDGTVDVYCKKCFMEKGLNRAKVVKTEAAAAPAEAAPEAE